MWVLGLSDVIIRLVPIWLDISVGRAFLTSRSYVSAGRRPTWWVGLQPAWKRAGSVELPMMRRIMRKHQGWSRSSDDWDPVMIASDDLDRVMIEIQWWWSSNYDPDRVMIQIQSSDVDPNREMIQIEWWCSMMIQIERWYRFSDDVLDRVWSSDDDLNQVMIQIQMKMTWRWWGLDDEWDDTEKKTCANKLCHENTFLVKRECWCNCILGMYSSVFLMYCNPMFIPGCIVMYLSHVIPQCLFQEVSIMRKSCQVIVGNPPIGQGLKSP